MDDATSWGVGGSEFETLGSRKSLSVFYQSVIPMGQPSKCLAQHVLSPGPHPEACDTDSRLIMWRGNTQYPSPKLSNGIKHHLMPDKKTKTDS